MTGMLSARETLMCIVHNKVHKLVGEKTVYGLIPCGSRWGNITLEIFVSFNIIRQR